MKKWLNIFLGVLLLILNTEAFAAKKSKKPELKLAKLEAQQSYTYKFTKYTGLDGKMGGNLNIKPLTAARSNSQILGWGKNSTGHLIKHRNVLGFGEVSPQQAQKMLPQLRGAANQLLNNVTPALTRVGQWHEYSNVIMRISNGKMLVTQANGTFITVINKTSNNWYNLASPLR